MCTPTSRRWALAGTAVTAASSRAEQTVARARNMWRPSSGLLRNRSKNCRPAQHVWWSLHRTNPFEFPLPRRQPVLDGSKGALRAVSAVYDGQLNARASSGKDCLIRGT